MITVEARLEPDDLDRYRRVRGRYEALRLNPRAFDAETSERICYEAFVIDGEMFGKYGGDVEEEWFISSADGTLYYKDA